MPDDRPQPAPAAPVDLDALKDLLDAALERPPEQRRAFCEARTAHDPAMRARVLALLDAWDEATTMLDEGPLPSGFLSGKDTHSLIGARIGPYTVESELGAGSFGVVYRARQDAPVARAVALKVMRPGIAGREFLARFDAERQALARLTHPAIARIYDAGALEDGRPYFVMELVDGPPITAYADAHRLSIRQRVALFIEVCRAVQHAHAKGVIHRDLKPSNILVQAGDAGPAPKVIDFGIAKATDEPLSDLSVLTVAHQVVGTPLYMSPEQAAFDTRGVDTRTDIFSLGAVLYELLCAQTPLSRDALTGVPLAHLHQLLVEARFERPSHRLALEAAAGRGDTPERLREALAPELDWIALRAIDPDPERRYPTVFALARDLERYLHDEPIEARPPARLYLARKFARRHRAALAGVGVVALSLVAGVVVSSAGLLEARRGQREAERELLRANEFRRIMGDMLGGVRPAVAQGRDATIMRDIVDAARARIEGEPLADPVVDAEMRTVMGEVYFAVGAYEQAAEVLGPAVEILRTRLGDDHPLTVSALVRLANVRTQTGESDEARRLYGAVLAAAGGRAGPDDPSISSARQNLGMLLLEVGEFERARALLEASLAERLERYGPDDERTLIARHNLLLLLTKTGGEEEAVEQHASLLQAQERVFGPDHPETLATLNNYARNLERLDRFAEADALYRSAVERHERILGAAHPRTLQTMNNHASCLIAMGDFARASEVMDRVVERAGESIPETHWINSAFRLQRGRARLGLRRYSESESDLLAAYAVLDGTAYAEPSRMNAIARTLANLYERWGEDEPGGAHGAEAERWRRAAGSDP